MFFCLLIKYDFHNLVPMDRKEQRKIFAKLKREKENVLKLKLVEKYPTIHRMYKNGELTLKQAHDGAQSEHLNINTFKSKGTKGFITHSTKINKKPSTHTLPFSKNPIGTNSEFNITFDEVNKMSFSEFKEFILSVRKFLLNQWDNHNIPPNIGKDIKGVIDDIQNLIDFDINKLYRKGDNIYEYIISNDYHFGSSCNQFQPSLHKTKSKGISMYDVIKEPSLELKWLRTFVRCLKNDKMYMVSKRLSSKKELLELDLEKIGLIIFPSKNEDNLTYSKSEVEQLRNNVLSEYHFKNIQSEYDSTENFDVRYYNKSEKIVKHIIHILRVGFSNTPINFSPLVGRYLYEKYLPNEGGIVYDSSAGWGGRLMASICSSTDVNYIGCDVNSNIFETDSYNRIGEFIDEELNVKSNFKVHKISSTKFDTTDDYKNNVGKVDLVLTSPPYFDTEQYSEDSEQSYKLYPSYNEWINIFIKDTFQIAYDLLKKGGVLLLNIADTKELPLEIDTLTVLEKIGFEFQYEIGMKMQRFLGLDTEKIFNRYYDEERLKYIKVEPILKFIKH